MDGQDCTFIKTAVLCIVIILMCELFTIVCCEYLSSIVKIKLLNKSDVIIIPVVNTSIPIYKY